MYSPLYVHALPNEDNRPYRIWNRPHALFIFPAVHGVCFWHTLRDTGAAAVMHIREERRFFCWRDVSEGHTWKLRPRVPGGRNACPCRCGAASASLPCHLRCQFGSFAVSLSAAPSANSFKTEILIGRYQAIASPDLLERLLRAQLPLSWAISEHSRHRTHAVRQRVHG